MRLSCYRFRIVPNTWGMARVSKQSLTRVHPSYRAIQSPVVFIPRPGPNSTPTCLATRTDNNTPYYKLSQPRPLIQSVRFMYVCKSRRIAGYPRACSVLRTPYGFKPCLFVIYKMTTDPTPIVDPLARATPMWSAYEP